MAAATSIGVVGVAGPAHADDCQSRLEYGRRGYYYTHCRIGPGIHFRAVVDCRNAPGGNFGRIIRGTWEREADGFGSLAICHDRDFPYAVSGWTEWDN